LKVESVHSIALVSAITLRPFDPPQQKDQETSPPSLFLTEREQQES
jgi:hypothetical protein